MWAFLAIPWVRTIGKWVLVAGVVGWVVWSVIDTARDWQDRQEREAVARREAEITVTSLTAQLDRTRQDLAAERTRLAELHKALEEERARAAERVAIFNRHRFGELLQAKPGLIEKRINSATADVWTQIEQESHP